MSPVASCPVAPVPAVSAPAPPQFCFPGTRPHLEQAPGYLYSLMFYNKFCTVQRASKRPMVLLEVGVRDRRAGTETGVLPQRARLQELLEGADNRPEETVSRMRRLREDGGGQREGGQCPWGYPAW